jgi:hypothetical protein
MDLILQRKSYEADGILSTCADTTGAQVMVTLEHAFEDDEGDYQPKIPPGTYVCIRGPHRLEGMTEDFITFEVTGVAGHTGLLFHWGNWNKDSDGCILTGEAFAASASGEMVTNSRATFARFMALQDGVDNFQLDVNA